VDRGTGDGNGSRSSFRLRRMRKTGFRRTKPVVLRQPHTFQRGWAGMATPMGNSDKKSPAGREQVGAGRGPSPADAFQRVRGKGAHKNIRGIGPARLLDQGIPLCGLENSFPSRGGISLLHLAFQKSSEGRGNQGGIRGVSPGWEWRGPLMIG